MTVEEIKAKLPEADVYELRTDTKYLILASRQEVSRTSIREIGNSLTVLSINAAIIHVDDTASAIRLLEFKE